MLENAHRRASSVCLISCALSPANAIKAPDQTRQKTSSTTMTTQASKHISRMGNHVVQRNHHSGRELSIQYIKCYFYLYIIRYSNYMPACTIAVLPRIHARAHFSCVRSCATVVYSTVPRTCVRSCATVVYSTVPRTGTLLVCLCVHVHVLSRAHSSWVRTCATTGTLECA